MKENVKLEVGNFTEHDDNSSYYLATLILKDIGSEKLRERLRDNNCAADFLYPYLHETDFWLSKRDLVNTENLRDRIINLPIHQNLDKDDLDKIVRVVNE